MKIVHSLVILLVTAFAIILAFGGCVRADTDQSNSDSGAPDTQHCPLKITSCRDGCSRADLGLGCIVCCERNGASCNRAGDYNFDSCFQE